MLGLPIYKLGNVYYLHTRIAGQQVKKSLRTGYKREALQRALALLHDMTKPTPFPQQSTNSTPLAASSRPMARKTMLA